MNLNQYLLIATVFLLGSSYNLKAMKEPELTPSFLQEVKNCLQNAIADAHQVESTLLQPTTQNYLALQPTHKVTINAQQDIVIAPDALHAQMAALFESSQDLLNNKISVEQHPLFKYFHTLKKDGRFITTLVSGPTIENFTDLMLGKHELEFAHAHQATAPSVKIFSTAETFFRCLDIFKSHYEKQYNKKISYSLTFSQPKIPLAAYCAAYVTQYPELIKMDSQQLNAFARLISVFTIDNNVTDLYITLSASVKDAKEKLKRSFMPVNNTLFADEIQQTNQSGTSNEISVGQSDLNKQIQNLTGSELSMPYIKDTDGAAQFKALKHHMRERKEINFVDFGGGRGETNAVIKAIQDIGTNVHLLSVEPHEPFAAPYIQAHKSLSLTDVHVLQKTAQALSAADITSHFSNQKADVLFASHSFYFLLADMHNASEKLIAGSMAINQHPLWKYFTMMRDDGVFVITLQSGAGARLFRNALLGNHGLNTFDETALILNSFGNMATFLRHFELFAQHYAQKTGKQINIKMHHAVANVPLGNFTINEDSETKGYVLNASDDISSKMLDFYGNWNELQALATQKDLPTDKKEILEKRAYARKMQETFLHILRVFAPAHKNMQHPNIVLEITVQA